LRFLTYSILIFGALLLRLLGISLKYMDGMAKCKKYNLGLAKVEPFCGTFAAVKIIATFQRRDEPQG